MRRELSALNGMNSEIAALEADVKEYRLQLDTVLASLQGDPQNAELNGLRTELEEAISLTQSAIADLKLVTRSTPPSSVPPQPTAPPISEKWSKENHPAFQPGFRKSGAPPPPPPIVEAPQAPATFQVNDMVLAKWVTGDKGFYPARITSITGSSVSPVYIVNFKSYGTSETLRSADIKPIASNNAQKRKADGSPVSSPSVPAPSSNSNVISAAANINPELATQAKKEPSKVSDGPPRPPKVAKNIKNKKDLETNKSNWQDFTTKGKMGKVAKKDSMFRTGESATARGEYCCFPAARATADIV